jgi:hypothetical protein
MKSRRRPKNRRKARKNEDSGAKFFPASTFQKLDYIARL